MDGTKPCAITGVVEASIRSLLVCTDASVRGPEYRDPNTGERKRYKVGPSAAACVGWVRCEASAQSVVNAEAVLGWHGTQEAEYEAAILGLEKSREYLSKHPLTHLLLCSDTPR